MAAHAPRGLVPAAATPHTPSAPEPFSAAEHAWHVPLHATLQQTPSEQLPEPHWLFVEQAAPCPRSGWMQLPAPSHVVPPLWLHAVPAGTNC
jgi:hypothetical protein